jgi:Tfp pilus assembly protein PilF
MGRKARDKKQRPEPAAARDPAAPAPEAAPPEAAPPVVRTHVTTTPRRERALVFTTATTLWMLGLVGAAAAVYASALGNPFLLDDPISITKNPVIQKPLSLAALAGDPRAVVTASLRWNYLAGGFDVIGYHVLNVLAHAFAGLLVFALVRATLALDVFSGRYRESAVHLAGVAALVFLLHPMQTESVTYVIQRAEIFVSAALAGSLLSLVALHEGRTRAGMTGLALACVFGMYSKPSFAVVPALLAVYDLCFLARGNLRAMVARWPAYALALAAAAMTFALTRMAGSFTSDTAGFDMEGITPAGYLSAQPGVVVHYLRRVLWPADLCFDCGYRGPWPVLPTFLGDSVVLPVAILAAIGAACFAVASRRPLFAFAFLASAVVLAPTSSVVPLADFYVEHRMYLVIAFVAMALVPSAWDALAAAARRFGLPSATAAAAGAATAAALSAGLAVATVDRNALLASPIALMEDALLQAPQSERLHYNLANAYKRENRLDEAEPHYREAIRLLPHIVRSYQNLGSLYLEQGKLEAALEVYIAGAAAKPGVAMAHRNVANTYLKLGRPEEALEAAERSLRIEPGNSNGLRIVAEAKRLLGR